MIVPLNVSHRLSTDSGETLKRVSSLLTSEDNSDRVSLQSKGNHLVGTVDPKTGFIVSATKNVIRVSRYTYPEKDLVTREFLVVEDAVNFVINHEES